MSELHDFLKEEMDEQSEKTHVAMLCRIVSFDSQQMKASIQPMQKGLPMIENVPVALQKAGPFFIRVPFEKGDVVVVVFADKGIDTQINTGADAEEVGARKHDISDAIVVGGITPFNSPLPAEAGLVIAKKDLSAKVVIQEDNKIVVETNANIYLGSAAADEGLSLGNALKQWADNHDHNYTWTDAAGSGTTDPPNEASPAPSEKVMTE